MLTPQPDMEGPLSDLAERSQHISYTGTFPGATSASNVFPYLKLAKAMHLFDTWLNTTSSEELSLNSPTILKLSSVGPPAQHIILISSVKH